LNIPIVFPKEIPVK